MKHVENIFNNLGMTNIWISPSFCSLRSLIERINLRQNDTFLQQWNNEKSSSSIFKENLCLEKIVDNFIKIQNFTPIEYRTCTFCNNDIGDEFHYVFMCTFFATSRKSLLKSYYHIRG